MIVAVLEKRENSSMGFLGIEVEGNLERGKA